MRHPHDVATDLAEQFRLRFGIYATRNRAATLRRRARRIIRAGRPVAPRLAYYADALGRRA